MGKTFLIGIAAALIGGLGLMAGTALGIEFTNIVLGVGGGLILGMVRIGSPLERLAGFGIGMVLGVFFAAMRLGLIPGGASLWGGVIAVIAVLVVITLISGLTRNHIGSWSMLLGVLVFVSGFLNLTENTPWTANSQVVSYFLSTLVMAAIGFLVVLVVEWRPHQGARPNYGHHFDADHPKRERVGSPTSGSDATGPEASGNSTQTNLQGIVGEQK